MSDIIWGFNAF